VHIPSHPVRHHEAERAAWDATTPGLPGERIGLRAALGWVAVGAIAALLFVFRPIGLGGTTGLVIVTGTSMAPAIASGDVAVVLRTDDYAVGDVIAYHPSAVPAGRIIHRIVGGDADAGFITRGDARTTEDPDRPVPAAIDGEVVTVLPGVGPVVAVLRDPLVFAALCTLLLVSVAARIGGGRRPAG